MNLDATITAIRPINNKKLQAAQAHWNSIAKPLYGMGTLEDYVSTLIAMGIHEISKRCVAVMCADNGIVAENVTQTGSEVTAIVAQNIAAGTATVCTMAAVAKADVFPFDVGMLTDCASVPIYKTARGTGNFLHECAMTRSQAVSAIESGIEIAFLLKSKGYSIIASGEMGIGNTTTSSAITASIFNMDAHAVTGKGAGLSAQGVYHKSDIINQAIALHRPNAADAIDVLCKVGGFDIAALCGLFLGGARYQVPVIIDGFISSVAALLAVMLCPHARDYMLASHISNEPAAKLVMDRLGFQPVLDCKMALGEGTGAVSLFPLLDMALSVYHNVPTFHDIAVKQYQPLC